MWYHTVSTMNTTSEEVQVTTDESVGNTSLASAMFPQPRPTFSRMVGFVSGITGTCTNAAVVVVLVFARRHFGSAVNTLITNQSVMDLLACIFITISCGMSLPGAPPNYLWLGDIGNSFVCLLFRPTTVAFFCMDAEKIGLSVTEGLHTGPWYDRRKDRSCGHHLGALLQGRPCHRSSEALSQLDDLGGRSFAVYHRSLHKFHPED